MDDRKSYPNQRENNQNTLELKEKLIETEETALYEFVDGRSLGLEGRNKSEKRGLEALQPGIGEGKLTI